MIQGTNASALKIALIRIDKFLEETSYGRLVLNVHDEVCVYAKEEYAEIVAQKVKEEMANALSYFLKTIKGDASVTIDTKWKK